MTDDWRLATGDWRLSAVESQQSLSVLVKERRPVGDRGDHAAVGVEGGLAGLDRVDRLAARNFGGLERLDRLFVGGEDAGDQQAGGLVLGGDLGEAGQA